MKLALQWVLLVLAALQFVAVALPPGNDDLISIQVLALDLSHHDASLLYPGAGFSHNDAWVVRHERNVRALGASTDPNWCFYPPLVPYLLAPLADAGAQTWRLVWGAVQFALLFLFGELIFRALTGYIPDRRPGRLLIYALVLGSYPVAQSVHLGQTTLLLALLFWLPWAPGWPRQRTVTAASVGIAAFVKPFLLIGIVPKLRDGRWREVFWIPLIPALLLLLSIYWVGWPAHVEYLKFLRTLADSQTAFAGNQSLLAGLARLFTRMPVLDYGFAQDPALHAIGRLLLAVVLIISAWAQWRCRDNSHPLLSAGMWISAILLGLSISWEHHLVFLLPVVAALWMIPLSRARFAALALSTLLMAVCWQPFYGDIGAGRVAACLPLFGNLILFILLVQWHVERPARKTPALES